MVEHEITPKEFGERLKKLRKLRGLSQVDIAVLLGITRSAALKIEYGQNKTIPSRENIIKLENHLEAVEGTLLGLNDFVVERYSEEEQKLLKNEASTKYVKEALVKMKIELGDKVF